MSRITTAFLGSPVVALALVYLGWGILSGAYLTIYDRKLPHSDDEWATFFQKSPKLAALNSLVKTLGWNLPGGLRALRVFFGGPLPKPIRDALADGGIVAAGKELGREAVEALTKTGGTLTLMVVLLGCSGSSAIATPVKEAVCPSFDTVHANGLVATREEIARFEGADLLGATTQPQRDAVHLKYSRTWELYGFTTEAWFKVFEYQGRAAADIDPMTLASLQADFSGNWQALQAELESTQPPAR